MNKDDRETLRALVETYLGATTVWADKPEPMTAPATGLLAKLTLTSTTRLGWDDRRNDYNADTMTLHRNIAAQRGYVITLVLESYDDDDANDLLEMFRIEMYKLDTLDAFREVGFAIRDVRDPIRMPHFKDMRAVSCSVCELHIGGVLNVRDTDVGTIESAVVEEDVP